MKFTSTFLLPRAAKAAASLTAERAATASFYALSLAPFWVMLGHFAKTSSPGDDIFFGANPKDVW